MTQDDTGPIDVDPNEIPEYDDDEDGDRREFLDSPQHKNIEDVFADEEPEA